MQTHQISVRMEFPLNAKSPDRIDAVVCVCVVSDSVRSFIDTSMILGLTSSDRSH